MAAAQDPAWVGASSPQAGRPLVPAVEQLARRLRSVAVFLEQSAWLPFDDLFAPRRLGLGYTPPSAERSGHRAAWAVVGEWLTAKAVADENVTQDLSKCHSWFWDGADLWLGELPRLDIKQLLADVNTTELRALMPYLLDSLAAATRRDVLKAPGAAGERRARKSSGVYYTPGDVAYLMVERVSRSGGSEPGTWLDPAHGSGVFLRAIFSEAFGRGLEAQIYGVDLDPMAAEVASFVLTAEDLALRPKGPPPWQRWHRFRANLVTGNALLIDASEIRRPSSGATTHLGPVAEAVSNRDTPEVPLGTDGPWRLETVFPEVRSLGFDRIVANPPYAPLKPEKSVSHLPVLHPVTGSAASRDVSPLFVEMSMRLLSPAGALAVVTPLSHVTSTRAPFPALRKALVEQSGRLDFLTFDRAPDALFGDDIKTRNAIIHLNRAATRDIVVSPLYRWTSRNRRAALASIPVVSVAGLPGLPEVVPKIGSFWERELFAACLSHDHTIGAWISTRVTRPLPVVAASASKPTAATLAIGPTAYNFLNVLREPMRAVAEGHDSRNGFAILTFHTERLASAAYALMSSRLALWLWHVTGDGFHVTARVTQLLPAPCPDDNVDQLACLGDALWKQASQKPVISKNAGRTSIAYPSWPQQGLMDAIDTRCSWLIPAADAAELAVWNDQLAVVDPDSRRQELKRRNNL